MPEKEIWKLLELLNEYHHFNSDSIYYWWDEEYERVYFHSELPEEQKKKLAKAGIDYEWVDEDRIDDEWLCSKKFWFIQWLVENDKIDRDKVREKSDFFPVEKVPEYNSYSDYESLLMLLSIQDEPIEFLISILKNV